VLTDGAGRDRFWKGYLKLFLVACRGHDSGELFARHGEEALSMLAAEPDIDLILLDNNMPVMDGLTLLARLREQQSPVRARERVRFFICSPIDRQPHAARIKSGCCLFLAIECGILRILMPKRPVTTATEARAGSKEGVVRYVLLTSLVLVAVLFVAAYLIF
jgi:hypothetical protein